MGVAPYSADVVLPSNSEPQNPWTRQNRQQRYDNPWIEVFHDEVIRPDGLDGIYGVVHMKHRAVAVVPIDANWQIALVGQWRYTLDRYSWEVPEGGCGVDEEPVDAARRELREETGLVADSVEFVNVCSLSNSVTDEMAYTFLATGLRLGGAAQPEGTEDITLRWVALSEALEMVAAGEIFDSLTVIGLLLAEQRRLQST
jgi:8-oxo-dGTP pyrophosphatase MutT (NUDIX family)